jgi:hypothetical protein
MALMQSNTKTMQPDTKTLNITVLWLIVSMPVTAWPIVRRSENSKLVNLRAGLTGMKGLMTAILYQAWEDSSLGDLEAMDWLENEAFDYCVSIGFNHNIILNWVKETREAWRKMDEKILEIKKRICNRMNLPGMCVDMLRGESEKEISMDAIRFLRMIGQRPPIAENKTLEKDKTK